jgi:hypothetical protein
VETFTPFGTDWDPKIVGKPSGQRFKIATLQQERMWHQQAH